MFITWYGRVGIACYLRGYIYIYICREASKDTPVLYKEILSLRSNGIKYIEELGTVYQR